MAIANTKTAVTLEARGAELDSDLFINLTAMPHVVKIYATPLGIEFVKHAVIAYPQLALRSALQALVRKGCELCSHFINLALHSLANSSR